MQIMSDKPRPLFVASVVVCTLASTCSVTYAVLCYIDTIEDAATAGCQQNPAVGPLGAACPSAIIAGAPGACGFSIDSLPVVIGVKGVAIIGRQDFTVMQQNCYDYWSCTPAVWTIVPPKWFCKHTGTVAQGGNWSAAHASGDPCGGT